jgi:hypothetical protein
MRRPNLAAPIVWLVALAGVAPAASSADWTPLYVIPTESQLAVSPPPGAPLRLRLQVAETARLAGRLGVEPPAAGSDLVVETVVGVQPRMPEVAGRTWLESTFVIDHDDPHVVALRDEYRREHPGAPTVGSIVAFVARRMQPADDQGFEFASEAATVLRGDCTEHAVLTAALARSLGLPARVALGIAVIRKPDESFGAYGHAWALVLEDGRWVIADAALAREDVQPRYLPLGSMQDEGPGFMLDLLEPMTNWVQRVVVVGSVDPR